MAVAVSCGCVRRWIVRLGVVALTLTMAACTSRPSAPADPATVGTLTTRSPSDADEQAADAAARAAFDGLDGRAPALYVGIWDPRRGYFVRAYGDAVRDGAPATTADSFRIASITKTFTATIVLQLVDEGRVDLHADIAGYLPAPLAGRAALHGITVEQLLAMRSGLPDYLVNPDGIARDIQADPHRVWTPLEVVDKAIGLGVAPPGTPGYTNTNFVLLGLIAEHVTGQPLADLIATRLTGPLGLRHTELPPPEHTDLPAPAAHGYLNQDCVDKAAEAGAPGIAADTDTTDWNTSYFQGAAGMISDLTDLGRWAATGLGTDLLSADLARSRLDARDIGGDVYGLGIKRYGAWYGHDGEAFGWDSLAVHNPVTGVTFVAVANACTGLNDDFFRLLATLYPDQPTQ